jgi:hypothetical protein
MFIVRNLLLLRFHSGMPSHCRKLREIQLQVTISTSLSMVYLWYYLNVSHSKLVLNEVKRKNLDFSKDKEAIEAIIKEGYNQMGLLFMPDDAVFIENFFQMLCYDFVPVYSVIGSVAAQEFIKVIGSKQTLSVLFCLNSRRKRTTFSRIFLLWFSERLWTRGWTIITFNKSFRVSLEIGYYKQTIDSCWLKFIV